MVIAGRIEKGVVVLKNGVTLPEGTEVSVVVSDTPTDSTNLMSDEQRRRILEIADRIAALPDENPGDTFRGADHDSALYGKR